MAILLCTALGAVPLLGLDESNPGTILFVVVGGITTPLFGGIGQRY